MARFNYSELNDNSILKLLAAPEIGDTQSTIDNPGVPLPPSKSPAVSDEAKENMKKANEKALKDLEESKPDDTEKGIDHPDNVGENYNSDSILDYESTTSPYQEELVDYYDPDDVINADIGDYVPKQYTGNLSDYFSEDVANIGVARESGLYIKSGNRTYFYNSRDGLAGVYLRELMSKIDIYLKANVSGFLKAGFNGVMRSLEDTLSGGPNRSKTSKHGAGLAIDLLFDTTKLNQAFGKPIDATNTYSIIGYKESNKVLAKDKKLTKHIRLFLKEVEDNKGRSYDEVIKWGGDFKPSSREDRKAGVRISEYHHFEIKDHMMSEFFEPIKDSLIEMNKQVPQNQAQLGSLYKTGLLI